DVLGQFNVERVDPKGEKFNPELHEALTMIPSPDHESNTVVDVIQKGYTLNERLVRAARVIVAQ
ncbi:MAG: nucleotide exchange factor GrpE, partial [Pseudomonadota bacterium]